MSPTEGAGTPVDIVFTPTGVKTTVKIGTSVLDAARQAGIDLDSTCGGRGLCGRCQVAPTFGAFAKWGINSTVEALSPWSSGEQQYKGRRAISAGNRLGCQAGVRAPVVIDIPAESAVHRPVVRKKVDLTGLTVDPLVVPRYVELPQSVLGDERSQSELLAQALWDQWQIGDVTVDARVLPNLGAIIAAGNKALTAILYSDQTVVALRPGFDEAIYGVAVDVGSTTIAAYLVDLTSGDVLAHCGTMNPQIRFGEDLMSRVSYVMMNKGGDRELTAAVRQALDALIPDLANQADLPLEEVRTHTHDLVVVGNPIMHHLVLGIDPTALGAAPFSLTVSEPVDLRADELEVWLPFAQAHIGPCIAGHVGADAAAAVLNEGTHLADEPQLVVDIGTNAEIVLGTSKATYAASSPTGPAFEGAQISSGVRATVGAIERIRINRETFAPRYKVIGADLWSDDPGFAEATSDLDIAGLCGSAIIEVVGEMFLAGVCDHNGVIKEPLTQHRRYVQPDDRTFRFVIRGGDAPLYITQNDIRQIQLAGAALRAGVDLLMEHAGVSYVGDIRLAGAFGTHIDPLYALVLGLVPDCPLDSVVAVGNASGAGAIRMLVSAKQRQTIARNVAEINKIETATEPRFQELFVNAMAFPHQTATSHELSKVVDLPNRAPQTNAANRKRRRTAAR